MFKMLNEKGFTILEGAVSIILLFMTVLGMYNIMLFAERSIIDARRMTEATNFARRKLERIMDTDFLRIPQDYQAGVTYDANPSDDSYFYTDPDGDYANALPNAKWQVEYFHPVSSLDPLTIRLSVFWKESGENKIEHRVRLSSRVTAGRV